MATVFNIEDIVDVVISIGDRPVAARDFGTPLVISTCNNLTEQVTEFTTLSQISASGFSPTSPLYKMASNIFGGAFKPKRILIAKRALTSLSATPITATTLTDYSVNVVVKNTSTGVTYNKSFLHTSDTATSAVEITTALAAAIELDSDINALVAAVGSTGALIVTPVANAPLSLGAVTSNLEITETAAETAAVALDLAFNQRTDFFYVASTDQRMPTILALAAWTEANKRVYYAASGHTDVYASGSADLLSQLQAFQYNNTAYISSLSASTDFPDAALIGATANVVPGSSSLFAKTLTGSAYSNFTISQANYVKAKGGNVYINRANMGWFEPGKAVSGRSMDITIGALYLESRIEEAVFGLIKRQSDLGRKIPYSNYGIQLIDSVIQRELAAGVNINFIESYKTFPPLAENISANDKALRVLNTSFEAVLSGNVEGVVVRGFLVLQV